jgi:hypothetical protein
LPFEEVAVLDVDQGSHAHVYKCTIFKCQWGSLGNDSCAKTHKTLESDAAEDDWRMCNGGFGTFRAYQWFVCLTAINDNHFNHDRGRS